MKHLFFVLYNSWLWKFICDGCVKYAWHDSNSLIYVCFFSAGLSTSSQLNPDRCEKDFIVAILYVTLVWCVHIDVCWVQLSRLTILSKGHFHWKKNWLFQYNQCGPEGMIILLLKTYFIDYYLAPKNSSLCLLILDSKRKTAHVL